MPWKAGDAKKKNKNVKTDAQAKKWAKIANGALDGYLGSGMSQSKAEELAVMTANSKFKSRKNVTKLLAGIIEEISDNQEDEEEDVMVGKSEELEESSESVEEVYKKFEVDIQKADLEKGYVGGIVLRANKTDLQGDWYDEDTVEETAHDFMENSRRIRYMHGMKSIDKRLNLEQCDIVKDEDTGKEYYMVDRVEVEKSDNPVAMVREEFGVPIESVYISKEFKDLVMNGKVDVGDWFMMVKATNPKLVEKIKNGEIKSFSIGAVAQYTKVEDDSGKEGDEVE